MTTQRGFSYTPFRDLTTGTLSGYYCASTTALLHQRAVAEDAVAMSVEDMQELALSDIETLRHVVATLGEALSRGARCLVSLPVHYETLASPRWRNAYVGLGMSTPRRMRQLVSAELNDLPEGVTQGRVLDMVSMLKPFVAAVIVRVPLRIRGFAPYTGVGIQALSADLEALGGATAEEAFEAVYRFSTGAEKAQLSTHLHNVRTTELALIAAAAGVRYADGESASNREDAPRQLRRYSPEEFLALVQPGA